ncbi:YsnF/AvaK domain-containing protein [Paeniroseomonas aquatica]|uniref:YsnF/AvaK domain-containing protein n=1 Tax=Paeniroseomonas aquatica TaxID=373043 RepID=A0ABT8AD01_9PROT|nr:YsnF/AvaK domain-containing protein [Paeniroseomonas aquatica]MDN3567682.1 YsnF/AvaK domain-containing protein [Paeniroseomonas aquatica]
MSNQTITAVFDSAAEAETAARDLAMKVGGVRAGLYASEADAASLRDLGVSGPDQAVLEEAIRRGGAVLSATVPEDRITEVTQVLEGSGAIDLQEREDSWRQSGWQGSGPTATRVNAMDTGTAGTGQVGAMATGTATTGTATTGTAATGAAATGRDEVIPVVEETLQVGKRQVASGRVRVHSHIVETPVQEQVTLHQEHVQVERRPVGRPVDVTADAFRDRTIEATETTEEAVIAKEARVVEEVVVRKTSDDETRTISDSVRRTEVEVEDDRLPRTAATPGTPKADPARER